MHLPTAKQNNPKLVPVGRNRLYRLSY